MTEPVLPLSCFRLFNVLLDPGLLGDRLPGSSALLMVFSLNLLPRPGLARSSAGSSRSFLMRGVPAAVSLIEHEPVRGLADEEMVTTFPCSVHTSFRWRAHPRIRSFLLSWRHSFTLYFRERRIPRFIFDSFSLHQVHCPPLRVLFHELKKERPSPILQVM